MCCFIDCHCVSARIYNAQPADSGTYVCVVSNDAGSVRGYIVVVIEGEKSQQNRGHGQKIF